MSAAAVGKRRVLITGLGALSPLGPDARSAYEGAVRGVGVAAPAPVAVRALLPHAIVGCVPDAYQDRLQRSERHLDRAAQFALIAAEEALADAGMTGGGPIDRNRIGVYVGVGLGGISTLDNVYTRFFRRLHRVDGESRDPAVVNPLNVPTIMANASAAWLSIKHGFGGPTQTFSVACASSAVALGEAYRTIAHGYADAVVVVGTESMHVLGALLSWNALRVMAQPDGEDVRASCRPFSADRNGFVLSEGAAAIVLQAADTLDRPEQATYGELTGYGITSDHTHISLPAVEGQVRAMRAALDDAGLAPDQIGYLNAHGTATAAGDACETASIRKAFGDAAPGLPISSTKSVHGHLIGAAGALEFLIAVLAMKNREVPPTAYLREQDPECDLDYVPHTARRIEGLSTVMSNSFAFGGTNVSLIATTATLGREQARA